MQLTNEGFGPDHRSAMLPQKSKEDVNFTILKNRNLLNDLDLHIFTRNCNFANPNVFNANDAKIGRFYSNKKRLQ